MGGACQYHIFIAQLQILLSFVPGLPLNVIFMAHIPLLRHQCVHCSCTTINNLITSYYHTIPKPQPQIVPLLSFTKLQHIVLIKQCRIDPALIIALVERWRPETHTFHLSWAECTITLEDVALHLGIRIDGRAVAGDRGRTRIK